MVRDRVPRPLPFGVRGIVLLALAASGAWAFCWLGLGLADLVPNSGGLQIAGDFFARALSPALSSEADYVPPNSPPLLLGACSAAGRTVVFAAAAMSLALVIGVVLGFFASTAWWSGDAAGGKSIPLAWARRTVFPAIYLATRFVITLMRSVHEILWAVLFLAAFGLNDVAALVAIAIPYGGTLAKIFSEMVDEAPRDAAMAFRGAGASGLQTFCFGLVPRAVPDMTAYAFYRFECALRSSAVLGFFGFETIGLYIRQSFKSLNYGEVWTYLYALLTLVVLFDWWSGAVRSRLLAGPPPSRREASSSGSLPALWKARPKSLFVRASLIGMLVLLLGSWLLGSFDLADALSAQRVENVERFWREVRPYPLQGVDWDWGVAVHWAGDLLRDRGFEAAIATLAISILAILLAAVAGLVLSMGAARNFATPAPFASTGGAPAPAVRWFWRAVVAATRLLLILLRALPEYLWAFLLVAMLGPTAWPAVLALAIHNAGILGRLGAETVENVEPRPLAALRALGARRVQIAVLGLFPATLPRLLMYFFYRWETCVREATVLGMLGVSSLGYWIADARTRAQQDTFVFLILLGAGIVLLGDLVSALVRRAVREAS